MEPLDLYTTPMQGVNLIEASAGTGKTYTISGLYIRLIIEQQLGVEQILVVTYTKAATAELRERIRSLLVKLRSALESGDSDELLCLKIIEGIADKNDALKRVNLAILSFDRAAIFTIHGFCQRVLTDTAFEGRQPFHTEMVADDRELLLEIVDDFWRRSIQDLPPGVVAYFGEKGITPDRLLTTLRGSLGKPYLKVRGRKMPANLQALESGYTTLIESAAHLWQGERDTISELLIGSDALKKNSYPDHKLNLWIEELGGFLLNPRGEWFSYLDRFTQSKLQASTKKGKVTPVHPFFTLCDELLAASEALTGAYEQARVAILRELIDYTNRELRERKSQRRLQSYDDLLLNLSEALEGDQGGYLAKTIRHRYRAALIDEFQDTDPVQYQIFHRLFVYDDHPLFLVGDPKQAIYSFRGADIFAYLQAKGQASHQFTLETNWRSSPGLIEAVNTLFTQSKQSFLFEAIPFHPVKPAPDAENKLKVEGDTPAPLRICFTHEKLNKEQGAETAASWTAAEISRLLVAAGEGNAMLDDEPLVSGDIAVLVRSHHQGAMVAHALGELGIHSVQRSPATVFESIAALELELVIRAVAEPRCEPLLPAALTTSLFGVSATGLDQLNSETLALDGWIETFYRYHSLWQQSGFMAMFRLLLREQEVSTKLLGLSDGERHLTDLLHLGELLHGAERGESLGMEAVVKWLSCRRSGDLPDDETHQLRLESDEALVQIVTIHKSKGLQYPVVFSPFVWDSAIHTISSGAQYRFHNPSCDHQATLDLGSEHWIEDQVHAYREEMSESLRLLYVALTRAKQRCYIHWGNINGVGQSALGWLLHGPVDPSAMDAIEQMKRDFKGYDGESLSERLGEIAPLANGNIEISVTPPEPSNNRFTDSVGKNADQQPLAARSFHRALRKRYQVTSFSALASGYHEASERPDHDATTAEPAEQIQPVSGEDIFHFPRGANPGTALHTIFERLDFSSYGESELIELAGEVLEHHGIDSRWSGVVVEMVAVVLNKTIEPATGLKLASLKSDQRLVEMEFCYPVRHLDAKSLSRLLIEHGFADTQEIEQAVSELDFARVEGYLKGFIDLIFEKEGLYYLLDYKSNWLGGEAAAYGQQQLTKAMAGEGYFLQYLLYTLALHRYLQQRLSDYDYDTHFGGVYYLFLRGIERDEMSYNGIYRARPSLQLVEALDSYFAENGKGL